MGVVNEGELGEGKGAGNGVYVIVLSRARRVSTGWHHLLQRTQCVPISMGQGREPGLM